MLYRFLLSSSCRTKHYMIPNISRQVKHFRYRTMKHLSVARPETLRYRCILLAEVKLLSGYDRRSTALPMRKSALDFDSAIFSLAHAMPVEEMSMP